MARCRQLSPALAPHWQTPEKILECDVLSGARKACPDGPLHLGACQCGLRVLPLPHIAGMMRSLCSMEIRLASFQVHWQRIRIMLPGSRGLLREDRFVSVQSSSSSLGDRARPPAGGPCSPVTRMQARYAGGRHVPTGSASGVLARRASRNGTCGPGAFRSGPPGQRGKNAAPHASAAYGGGARRWCVGYSAADPPGVGDQ